VVLFHHGDTTEVGLVVLWLSCSIENMFDLRKIRTRRLVVYKSSHVVDCVFEACKEEGTNEFCCYNCMLAVGS
jgi:hypothetical protein